MSPRVTLAIVILVALVLSAPALAGSGNPAPSNPSTSVYVEQIPTGSGSVVAGSKGSSKSLSPSIRNKVKARGGADASALEKVATSPGLGAPTKTSKPTKRVAADSSGRNTATPGSSAASVQSSSGNSGSALPVILVSLLLVTAVVGLVYWRRMHAPRPHSTPSD